MRLSPRGWRVIWPPSRCEPPIAQHAVEFVRAAAQRVQLAIASGAFRREIEHVLSTAGVRDYFTAVVSIDDVANGKPDPEGFLRALELLNAGGAVNPPIEPWQAVAVEDATAGAHAARAAGMRVAAIRGLGYRAGKRIRGRDDRPAGPDCAGADARAWIDRGESLKTMDRELELICEQVPELASADRRVTPISGGMTNRNYRVGTRSRGLRRPDQRARNRTARDRPRQRASELRARCRRPASARRYWRASRIPRRSSCASSMG